MKNTKLAIPKLFSTSSKVRTPHEVFPFTQQPSENQFQVKPSNKNEAPSELFSRFTADIIREEVIFTR